MYRIHDRGEHPGCFFVEREEARFWNNKGWGIFDCPNPIQGKRCAANVTAIRYWFADMDEGSKEEQLARVAASPLPPSLVVESARGFHLYWRAKAASKASWRPIVSHRLVPSFHADPRASDMSRLLRVPGYLHQKGEPFEVKLLQRHETSYTEDEMLFMFPEVKPADRPVKTVEGDGFWKRVGGLDCAEALRRLSGHPAVRGETFELRHAGGRGGMNIYVDGKSTSCFVDAEGKIGSSSDGGPTIANWLSYYGHSWGEVAAIIKEVFPEVVE